MGAFCLSGPLIAGGENGQGVPLAFSAALCVFGDVQTLHVSASPPLERDMLPAWPSHSYVDDLAFRGKMQLSHKMPSGPPLPAACSGARRHSWVHLGNRQHLGASRSPEASPWDESWAVPWAIPPGFLFLLLPRLLLDQTSRPTDSLSGETTGKHTLAPPAGPCFPGYGYRCWGLRYSPRSTAAGTSSSLTPWG